MSARLRPEMGGGVSGVIDRRPDHGADSHRPPIVLLHGIGGGKAQWAAQVEALAKSGWRAIAWDLPGYGDNRASLPEPFSFAAVAAALVRLLDALDIERAIVLGHSMGGMVALETYARSPERCAALVLACTSAAFGGRDAAWKEAFVAERLAPLDAGHGMTGLAAAQVPRMMMPHADRSAVNAAIAIMSAVPERTYRRALLALPAFDRRDVLPAIDVPTLVLAATADRQSPPSGMEKMASRIPGAEFVVLPDCAHLANLDRPDAFAAAVVEFVNRRCEIGARHQFSTGAEPRSA